MKQPETAAAAGTVYLTGSSLHCASGSLKGNDTLPDSCPTPQQAEYPLLGETRRLPYFSAFGGLLDLAALADHAERHIRQAAAAAGWTAQELAEAPVFIGSGSYMMADHERHGSSGTLNLNGLAAVLADRLQHRRIYCFATACTASAHALIQAAAVLRAGFARRAVVLGIESFNRLTLSHFDAMGLLQNRLPYRPFHDADGGMVLGEAAAALALSAEPPAHGPVLTLHGETAHTDTADFSRTTAAALERLLRDCLQAAAVSVSDLTAVKIHGAGGAGDAVERQVLNRLLPAVPQLHYKPYGGHTLGAAAALETALFRHSRPAAGSSLHYFTGFGGSLCAWVWRSRSEGMRT